MAETPEQIELPPGLRWLKWLVTTLMVTLILGVIAIVALLVTRLPGGGPAAPLLPASLSLPAGAAPQAITQGQGWVGVVTTDNRLFLFAPDGRLLQEIAITLPEG